MLHNPKPAFQPARECISPAIEARRLRLEYNKLQRRLDVLHARSGAEEEVVAIWAKVERITRDLGLIRADSVHAVESKLKVALDLIGDGVDDASHKLLSSALADLHYLAVLSDPSPARRRRPRQREGGRRAAPPDRACAPRRGRARRAPPASSPGSTGTRACATIWPESSSGVDPMHGAAMLARAVGERARVGVQALVGRQQRGVDVEIAAPAPDELRRSGCA